MRSNRHGRPSTELAAARAYLVQHCHMVGWQKLTTQNARKRRRREASGRRVGRALFSSGFHAHDALRRRSGALISRSCDCGRRPKPDRRRALELPTWPPSCARSCRPPGPPGHAQPASFTFRGQFSEDHFVYVILTCPAETETFGGEDCRHESCDEGSANHRHHRERNSRTERKLTSIFQWPQRADRAFRE
jgi:hypothetical protein